jgi:hypothetical protein
MTNGLNSRDSFDALKKVSTRFAPPSKKSGRLYLGTSKNDLYQPILQDSAHRARPDPATHPLYANFLAQIFCRWRAMMK